MRAHGLGPQRSAAAYGPPRWATKATYDCRNDRWDEERVQVRIEDTHFAEGGMRFAYRALELSDDGSESEAVVKAFPRSHLATDPNACANEAMTQMVAESYAQDFNKLCAQRSLPHRVAFLPVSALTLDEEFGEQRVRTLGIEPFLPGDYVKQNDNDGHNDDADEIALAFSYFTYVTSGHSLVVCDIQGVGTFYTDPQIHTYDGDAFAAGNLGEEGIITYLRSHRHNLLCEQLGLESPDAQLSDTQLAIKLQLEEQRKSEERWGGEEWVEPRPAPREPRQASRRVVSSPRRGAEERERRREERRRRQRADLETEQGYLTALQQPQAELQNWRFCLKGWRRKMLGLF